MSGEAPEDPKRPTGKRLTRVRPWALGAISLVAVTFALATWRPVTKQSAIRSMIPFDRELWRESPGQQLDLRMRMVRDLFDRHLALGTPRSDALALLGPPDYSRTLPIAGEAASTSKRGSRQPKIPTERAT